MAAGGQIPTVLLVVQVVAVVVIQGRAQRVLARRGKATMVVSAIQPVVLLVAVAERVPLARLAALVA